ncbi:MAG: GNAT family N-acetyltransferase [Pseudomonadota bacterium]|nr:GNAT family N-acetyltransferase [Pseudomonadota bacterium]
MDDTFVFTEYRDDFEFELLRLWRKSISKAIGVEEDTRLEAVNEHLEFLRSLNHEFIQVALEATSRMVIGFMRVEEHVIRDLFIHVDYQRQGLGSRFIQQAKKENDFLSLSTFELNKGAQKFYDVMGFVITDRGFASFEGNSWATSKDQLADITYEWRRT